MIKGYSCPICGNPDPNIEDYYDSDIHATVEEYINCDICGYSYEYAYGHYEESFGKNKFVYTWKTKHNNPLFKRRKKALFMARRNWKKGLKKREIKIDEETDKTIKDFNDKLRNSECVFLKEYECNWLSEDDWVVIDDMVFEFLFVLFVFLIGLSAGIVIESRSLKKWFNEELDKIYKSRSNKREDNLDE